MGGRRYLSFCKYMYCVSFTSQKNLSIYTSPASLTPVIKRSIFGNQRCSEGWPPSFSNGVNQHNIEILKFKQSHLEKLCSNFHNAHHE